MIVFESTGVGLVPIRGAWYLKQFPDVMVVEWPDGFLGTCRIAPFRSVSREECEAWKAPHPARFGTAVFGFVLKQYGLEVVRDA